MAEQPLLSVIIPVFNGEQYLRTCLNNMLEQSYPNLEIIVVDDGSVDESAAIASQYPVSLVRHAHNRGLSAARNTGIDHASGKYIHFMDVDDSINQEYYQRMASALEETGAVVACGGMCNQKSKYKSLEFEQRRVYTDTDDKLRVTFVGKWGYVWRYLFLLEYIRKKELRFEEGRFIEDLMFSLPAVYYAQKLVVVPGTRYYYYHRENSIMTRRDQAHRDKRRRDKRHAKKFLLDFAAGEKIQIPWVHNRRFIYLLRKIFSRF